MIETTENKPKLTNSNFKPELTTNDSWINDSVFICDLTGLSEQEEIVALKNTQKSYGLGNKCSLRT